MSLAVSTAEILVSDLPTKSIILTPVRATVVREFQTTIQPGQNEITILGIDPTVDVGSIRVDGSGPATITDIQTQKVPRRETFEDVYPETDSEPSDRDSDRDSDSESDDYGIDNMALQVVREEIAGVEAILAKAQGNKEMSQAVTRFMDGYGEKLNTGKADADAHADADKLNDFLQLYVRQHAVECERRHKATVEIEEAEKTLERLRRKSARLEAAYNKAKEAVLKETREKRKKRLRERADRRKKRDQVRGERRKFWTAEVGQVVVHLDSLSGLTPGSSRRSSIVTLGKAGVGESVDVTLRLTYVIPGPCWVPRYDLRISTPSASARLTYRAEFQNSSAETWRDTQVTLSTSQASFSGLGEAIPQLQGWQIKLDPSQGDADQPAWNNILRSFDESGNQKIRPDQLLAQRAYMKQLAEMQRKNQERFAQIPQARMQMQQQMQQQIQQHQQQQLQQQMQIQQQVQAPPPPPPPAARGMAAAPRQSLFGMANPSPPDNDSEDEEEADDETLSRSLEHQDSVKQDYGLTTTYELPGLRTLTPSSVARRHILAELDLKSMTLTHMIVPRVRAAAFLRARIQNTTAVGIQRGRAGITVDGTFLGTTTVANCGPNDAFHVSLGVDPSVLVTYAKPSVRRTAGSFFSKEHAAVFRRSCWVKNTKGCAVDLIVTDQVPVSEDEKLRVQILEPKGLEKEGDRTTVAMEMMTGKGTASLTKNGEVKWVVKLQPGKEIRLVLEYEARVPLGSQVDLVR